MTPPRVAALEREQLRQVVLHRQAMNYSRRNFLTALGMVSAGLAAPMSRAAEEAGPWRKPHLVTLSFDDGFKKSFARIAEIYEQHRLSACLNVVAAGLPGDAYIKSSPLGDFAFWNELKRRGHEIHASRLSP